MNEGHVNTNMWGKYLQIAQLNKIECAVLIWKCGYKNTQDLNYF